MWVCRQPPPGRGSSVASDASQRVSFSGSVKKANTISGLASISRSWTIGSVRTSAVTLTSPLFSLDLARQGVEALAPELVQEGAQVGQALGTGAVEPLGALPPLGEEPGLLEDADVLGDRRPGHGEVRGDLAGGELAIPDQREDL